LWSRLPICNFSAHFKLSTGVTHVGVQHTLSNAGAVFMKDPEKT
jgi:hypothetical protein